MVVVKILTQIVRELKKRGILTEVLQSANVNPMDWTLFNQEHEPFND